MIYQDKAVNHGLPRLQSNAYVVFARQGNLKSSHICHTYIVVAESPRDAIARVQANAKAVIEAVRQNCTPEDLKTVEWVQEPGLYELKRIEALEQDIEGTQNKLDDLGDAEDELSCTRRDALIDYLQEARSRLAEIRKGKPAGQESVFDRITAPMRYLLAKETHYEAKRLSGERAYPVAYFDDCRSITSYVPHEH